MGPFEYEVAWLDGDYAHLRRLDQTEADLKLVARALLPGDIYEGAKLKYECFEYFMI